MNNHFKQNNKRYQHHPFQRNFQKKYPNNNPNNNSNDNSNNNPNNNLNNNLNTNSNNDLEQNTNTNTNTNSKDIFNGFQASLAEKTRILNYLYLNVDLYQIRYTVMKTTENAQYLKQQPYFVSPHFQGYNCLLIVLDSFVYLVYRMDLKFERSELNDQRIRIYTLNSNVLPTYNNTIMDGKLVYKGDQILFLISDVYLFCGNKYLTFLINDKFVRIEKNISEMNKLFNCGIVFKMIKLYSYSEMNDLVFNKIKTSDFKINGLIFIPFRSGRIFVYLNDAEFEKIKNTPSLELISSSTNIKIPQNASIEDKILLLQKTLIMDVYDVFSIDKTYRFGIACVPNIQTSHKLRKYFEINNQLITKCTYDNKFSKWKPICDF